MTPWVTNRPSTRYGSTATSARPCCRRSRRSYPNGWAPRPCSPACCRTRQRSTACSPRSKPSASSSSRSARSDPGVPSSPGVARDRSCSWRRRSRLTGCIRGARSLRSVPMWSVDRPSWWVGREQELATLRAGVEALKGGEGTVLWVEGEPGIGKSSLVAEALAANCDPSWDIGWGTAGTLTQRLPLRAMLDCLQVRPGSPDPRRARAAALLRGFQQGLYAEGDTSAGGIEVLEALVDELCAAAPTVIVIDDLQWADESSLVVWHQLAASITQLPLLLIATCRPTPVRAEVLELRAAIARRGGAVV